MSNVIIIHGAYGYPEENWFGWLKCELHKRCIHCEVPTFPTPDNQSLIRWLQLFDKEYQHDVTAQTILIGHSLGAAFILRWLEQTHCKVSAVILIGAFIGKVGIERFDIINDDFFHHPFNWRIIQDHATQFIIYRGDNDPYVSMQDFHFISQKLNARKIIISQGGHLNTAAGYTQFPQLLLQLQMLIYP